MKYIIIKDTVFYKNGRLLCVALAILTTVVMMFSSCTRTVYVPKISVEHDSIYIATHTRDSVYLHDSVYIREKGDTAYLERWRTKFVERLRVDTTTVTVSDTIREPYPVEKPLTKAQRTWIVVGRLSATLAGMAATIYVALLFRRRVYGY